MINRPAQPRRRANVLTAKHKTDMLDKMLDDALKELSTIYEFDTVSSLLAQYEVVEDIAFAARRHRAQQQQDYLDDLELYCLDNPETAECRMYDI